MGEKSKLLLSDSDDEENDEIDDDDDTADVVDPFNGEKGKEATYNEFAADYKKFWQANQSKKDAESGKDEIADMFEDKEHSLKQKLAQLQAKTSKPYDEVEEPDDGGAKYGADQEETEETGLEHADSLTYPQQQKSSSELRPKNPPVAKRAKKDDVDPDNFITIEPKTLHSSLPNVYGYNEDDNTDEDEDEDQRQVIAEAFAEDDVMADFVKEKEELVAASKPKDIDLTLPGWGEWGGGGLMPSKRKRKRFTIKAPPAEKRRDENRKHLIINADKDSKIRAHKVAKLPYQFSSVSDFEASIRAPVGDTFIPRTAFLRMVQPKVRTKMGEVIQPMDRSVLLKRNINIKE